MCPPFNDASLLMTLAYSPSHRDDAPRAWFDSGSVNAWMAVTVGWKEYRRQVQARGYARAAPTRVPKGAHLVSPGRYDAKRVERRKDGVDRHFPFLSKLREWSVGVNRGGQIVFLHRHEGADPEFAARDTRTGVPAC